MLKQIFYSSILMMLFSCTPKPETLNSVAQNYKWTKEKDLKNTSYQQEIDNFYTKGKEGVFKGENNVSIYYKTFENPNSKQCILISTGRTEATIKYKELFYDLYHNGYSVYVHDHRGQGFSDRMLANTEMGYVDQFENYILDMKTFYNQEVAPKNYQKKYLMAHSMGGAIGFGYLQQFPNDFNAASFSSPMLGLSFYIGPLTKILKSKTPSYALGQKGYSKSENSFNNNALTGSKLRYLQMLSVYNQNPKAKLGGVTYQWLNESCKQFKKIFANINQIKTPFVLFSAAQETIVNPNAHYKFVKKAEQLKLQHQAYTIQNAKHELWMEKDLQRALVLNKTLAYFKQY